MKWKEYKKLILPTIKDYGESHFYVLSCGLGSKIGDLIKCDFNDLRLNKTDNNARNIEFGDMLWYLAVIEIAYNLPDNLYSHMFELSINTPNLNKAEINSSLLVSTGDIVSLMHIGDLQELQYELNNLASNLIDYADFHNINIQDCIKASLMKLNLRKSVGKKQPSIEYNSIKKMIKESGREELLVEAQFFKGAYKSINISYKGQNHLFNNGDLIVDFFDASTFIEKTYKDTGYVMNFGPKIRTFLKSQSEIMSGFIMHDDLITSISLRKSGKVTVQGFQQSFFKKDMTKLNQLLDYINEYKKQNA